MENPKSSRLVYITGYVITLLMGSLNIGYNLNIFSIFQQIFMQLYDWNGDDKLERIWSSVMTTLMPIGAIVTSLTSVEMMKRGRRMVLFIAAFFCFIGAFFMVIIHNPGEINNTLSILFYSTGRLFMGFAVGIYSTDIPTYINEISPKHLTGMFGACHNLCIALSCVISSAIGMGLPDLTNEEARSYYLWRISYAAPLLLSFIQVILILTIYRHESPFFYIYKNDEENAKIALQKLYSDNNEIDEVYKDLINVKENINKDGESISFSVYKKALLIGILLPALQRLTGITAVLSYAPTMFSDRGDFKELMTFIVMVVYLLFTIVSVFISDRIGRKILLIGGSIGCGMGLFLATMGYNKSFKEENVISNWLFDIGVFIFIASYGVSYGPICWIYISEILPSQWMGFGIASSWTIIIIISITTPYMLADIGRWTFFIFFVCMVFASIFCAFFIKETKGKTKNEIMALFINKQIQNNKNENIFYQSNSPEIVKTN